MLEGFGVPTKEELNWKFDVEYALKLLPELVEKEDMLWINLLHKLNIYAKEDERTQMYTNACMVQ